MVRNVIDVALKTVQANNGGVVAGCRNPRQPSPWYIRVKTCRHSLGNQVILLVIRSFKSVERQSHHKHTKSPGQPFNMSPSATYDTAHPSATGFGTAKSRPQLCKMDASDPNTTPEAIIEVIERDGGLIVQNLITHDLAQTIKAELKPYFDNDVKDPSGFFPATTQRATGLVGISPACVDYLTTPLLIDVANKLLTSKFTYFLGEKPVTVESKPQISSTVGFRVNPGGTAQALHRDDA